jgi:Ca2+-binding RTX toxin-like protein
MSITSSYTLQTTKSEFTANTFTAGLQMLPQVLALSNGGFVVAYNNQSAVDGYILLDFYDSNANHTQVPLRTPHDSLAEASALGTPSLAQLANGNVVVVWEDHDPSNFGLNQGIKAAMFTPYGEKIGAEKTIIAGNHNTVHVEAMSGDAFQVSFTSQNHVHSVYFVDFPWSSSPNVDLSSNGVAESTSAMLANGGLVVAWRSDPGGGATSQLHARIYSNDGLPTTGELTIDGVGSNSAPSLVGLKNGMWAVAYQDTSWPNENGSNGISLNILTPHGTSALLGPIHVNAGNPFDDAKPELAVLENGFILVTWSRASAPGSYDIYGRVFTPSGDPVTIGGSSGEFLISSASGNDTFQNVAALYSGKFVTAWTSEDNNAQEIAAVVKELVRTTTGDNANDTIIGDALRDIISSGGGNDTINAGAGNDVVNAGAGNDTIIEGSGEDFIDGGAGDDTVVFSHSLDRYFITEYGSKSLYVSGADGTDKLTNVEHLQFTDGRIDLFDDGNPLFDTPYYLSENLDVFHAGVNALDHFNTFGWHEGRNPNQYFDTAGYLATNKDVAAAGVNPLDHYHQTGWHEGRDPSAWFDTTLYLIHNPDVAAAGVDPLAHYLQFGIDEGRHAYKAIGQNIVSGFDAEYYLLHNPDVAAAGADPLTHYNTFGWHEGRNPNAYFDTAGYLSHYADVAASGVNPLQHYEQFGWHEGRDPSAQFDTLKYLAANPDVAAAGVNPLDHFLNNGIYEGRIAFDDGIWH